MSDILDKIVAVKRDEIAQAMKKMPLAVMRADAESRVLTRDFTGALRAKVASWIPGEQTNGALWRAGLPKAFVENVGVL